MNIPPLSSQNPGGRAYLAEQEANEKSQEAIKLAQARAAQAQRDAEVSIEKTHDAYETQYLAEESRQNNAIESQRTKGYEQIRDLQRAQQNELNRIRREGDKDLQKSQDFYKNRLVQEEKRANQSFQELQSTNDRRYTFEKTSNDLQYNQLKEESLKRLNETSKNWDNKLSELGSNYKKKYEELETVQIQAIQGAAGKFDAQYQKDLKSYSDSLQNLYQQANHQFQEIRKSMTDKLAAYQNIQEDPFYRLKDLQAQLVEEADHFVLTANIPPHEQEHLSVSVKGNNLVLLGSRRSHNIQESEAGHKQGTSSYQTFSESFPLSWPVDAKRLTRESNGSLVTIRVPKQNQYASQGPSKPYSFPEPTVDFPHLTHTQTRLNNSDQFKTDSSTQSQTNPPKSTDAYTNKTLG